MRDHIDRLCRFKQGDDAAIRVEAEIAVICHDVNRIVPRNVMESRTRARAGVVDSADVDSGKSNTGEGLEDLRPTGKWHWRVKNREFWRKRVVTCHDCIHRFAYYVTSE